MWNFLFITFMLLEMKLVSGYLYPYESESREVKSLNGLWDFKLSPESDPDIGFKSAWYNTDFSKLGDYIKMPVPASFNDITTNKTVRDYLGWAWYQRSFYAPRRWLQNDIRVFIHFGGVHYIAAVFLNGIQIGEHEGGHLPFQLEVPSQHLSNLNVLTVAVNNILTPDTVPQGHLYYPNNTMRYPRGYKLYSHNFDYFDYAGINRPVMLYTTPQIYISGITVQTDIEKTYITVGTVKYSVSSSGAGDVLVKLYDRTGQAVAQSTEHQGTLLVHEPELWWPAQTCHEEAGYLYTLKVTLRAANPDPDVYNLPVGIRTVTWTNNSLLINGKSVYLRGFGMHEDADIRGRGFDFSVMSRDLNLISWIGANAIRTSHYPYAEETLNQADAQGILVILEAPACSLNGFGDELYKRHKDYVIEMMEVHKNRPSVIMWSLANEPESNVEKADQYFRNLSGVARQLDTTRPVTFVTSQQVANDTAVQYMDVICVNRYPGWYSDSGHTDLISYQVTNEVTAWQNKFFKPVIVTEYGAGSLAGLHTLPESMWSEDYQVVTHLQHFKAFDELRQNEALAGEMIWNFIDFNTPQEYFRPGRCSKGLFTRERQPKSVAYVVRNRYLTLDCSHAV